jgi:hypothetical protein
VIEPAVLLVCTEGTATDDMLLCIATSTRIENMAEPSRFAGKNGEHVSIQRWMCCIETYPMLSVLRDDVTEMLAEVFLLPETFVQKRS